MVDRRTDQRRFYVVDDERRGGIVLYCDGCGKRLLDKIDLQFHRADHFGQLDKPECPCTDGGEHDC